MAIAVSAKIKATSAVASVTGFITYLLVTFVPSFHSGLPTDLATLLPYVIAVVLGVAAGWLKKETKAVGVGEDWITRGEAVLSRLEAVGVEVENVLGELTQAQAAQALVQAANKPKVTASKATPVKK